MRKRSEWNGQLCSQAKTDSRTTKPNSKDWDEKGWKQEAGGGCRAVMWLASKRLRMRNAKIQGEAIR
jgi:hypothetical protein